MTPKYFLELGEMMCRVEASDETRRPLGYDEGIRRATELVRGQTAAGRKVIFVGNGGSAAIASHQAVDYWKNGAWGTTSATRTSSRSRWRCSPTRATS
jgi:D-sedoheptulose 7-phosphate isomerase